MLENRVKEINSYNNKINKLLYSIDARVITAAAIAISGANISNGEFRKLAQIIGYTTLLTAVYDIREVLLLNRDKNEMVRKLTM